MKNKILIKIKKWVEENALCQTTYSDTCSDDGDIMFKRKDINKDGDWTQKEWDEKIKDFEEEYIDYDEFINFLEDLDKNEKA